jgi:hypothetical protein
MEIDLNPNKILKLDQAQPVARHAAAPAASSQESLPAATALQNQLNDLPVVRQEMVDRANSLASATSYPPVELLNRIATLLAVHLKQ